MAFNFFKKKDDGVPDVGKEEEYEEEKMKDKKKKKPVVDGEQGDKDESEDDESEEPGFNEEETEEPYKELEDDVKHKETDNKDTKSKKINEPVKKTRTSDSPGKTNSMASDFQFEKIEARIQALDALIKGFNERFSGINQQIGELRGMVLSDEKALSKLESDSLKAVDIVKEVKPEKLRFDYQKMDMKVSTLSEKLEANKQLGETIMSEVKDLRQKAGIFVGTDALLKLNEDVKKDLIELQRVAGRVRVNADKSEQIFVELKKGFAQSEKVSNMVSNLDNSYSGLQKEIEKLKVDFSNIVGIKDFDDFRKMINGKFSLVDNAVLEMDKLKTDNERMMQLIEKAVLISKKNHEDVEDIAMTIGDDKIKRVSEYEDELNSILKIIDSLAGQISVIKKKIGISDKKIPVIQDGKKIVDKNTINFKNIDVPSKISKPLIARKISTLENVEKKNEEIEKKSAEKIKDFDEIERIQNET